jgi:hypothetical protein
MMGFETERNKAGSVEMQQTRRSFLGAVAAEIMGAGGCLMGRIPGRAQAAEPAVKRFPSVAQIRGSSPDAWKLVDLINDHRRDHGLSAIPLSPRLTTVAYLHAKDLAERRPHETHGNLHSWSDDARWKGGAYRSDDKRTWPVMWEKPKEITGYLADGFEICAAQAKDLADAFGLWTQSRLHHDVILNRGVWADARWQWKALGAVFYRGFACAWFGNLPDGD